MTAKTMGQRIRELRMQKGLTQSDLAMGIVTPSMISQLESGKAHPSHKVLFKLAAKLDVSVDTFLKDIDLDLE
jgi:HTH-type transcriptional regulator, quorum sensing regulator NprR